MVKPPEELKREFIEKYAPRKNNPITFDYEPIPAFLSDLDEVIRGELIAYDKWCEELPNKYYSYSGVELVNEYLKSQQK